MNKRKVLFVATVVKTHINVFHLPYLKMFQEFGYITYVCAKNDFPEGEKCIIPYCDVFIDTPFSRNPLNRGNIKAYNKLIEILRKEQFEIIHCHTPVGGALTRIAAKNAHLTDTRVIYTAHGFHFFKGAPLVNWLIFYPIEKWLARYTDILITINEEDYTRAKKFKCKRVELVKGVGINIPPENEEVQTAQIRRDLMLDEEDIVLLSIGELIKRKNHSVVLKAISHLGNPHVKYLICGSGSMRQELEALILKLHLQNQVFLLGFRKDINAICKIADIFIFPSLQEGLPVALMEAMSNSLPVIASKIRGNIDLLNGTEGGLLVPPKSVKKYEKCIEHLINYPELRPKMGRNNYRRVQAYTLEQVMCSMQKIYFD